MIESQTTSSVQKLPNDAASLLELVLDTMDATPHPRLRQLMADLTRRLHGFVVDNAVTEDEFERAVAFLIDIGQATNETSNEVILAADLLGISSLVAMLNNVTPEGHSHAALLGPFWRANAPVCAWGDSIARSDTPGVPLEVGGTIRDAHGRPLQGATVDVWQASPVGLYENQDPTQDHMNLRGRFQTDAQGRFFFRSVRPAGYPVPTSGPCGALLEAQMRHPNRPAHLHFMISSPGHKVLVTQVFADDAPTLLSDPVFGVLEPLVGQFFEGEDDNGTPLCRLTKDFQLLAGEMRFPHPPIP